VTASEKVVWVEGLVTFQILYSHESPRDGVAGVCVAIEMDGGSG
jgi:hypothetical protein